MGKSLVSCFSLRHNVVSLRVVVLGTCTGT